MHSAVLSNYARILARPVRIAAAIAVAVLSAVHGFAESACVSGNAYAGSPGSFAVLKLQFLYDTATPVGSATPFVLSLEAKGQTLRTPVGQGLSVQIVLAQPECAGPNCSLSVGEELFITSSLALATSPAAPVGTFRARFYKAYGNGGIRNFPNSTFLPAPPPQTFWYWPEPEGAYHFEVSSPVITGVGNVQDFRSCSSDLPVEIADPGPELITGTPESGFTLTTDVELLRSGGRSVLGVTADGTARVLVRVSAQVAGQQLLLSLYDENNQSVVPSTDYGGLLSVHRCLNYPSGPPNQFGGAACSQAVETSQGPMAFFQYQAPPDFVLLNGNGANVSARFATARVFDLSQPGTSKGEKRIQIRRPLVILASPSGSPGGFQNLYLDTRVPVGVSLVDIQFGIEGRTLVRAARMGNAVLAAIDTWAEQNSVAAAQADLVTYSRSGVLARAMSKTQFFRRKSNYGKGTVHKLITIGTPHLGSDLLGFNVGPTPLGAGQGAFCWSMLLASAYIYDTDQYEVSPTGTASALSGATPIPIYAIAGVATVQQESGFLFNLNGALLNLVCNFYTSYSLYMRPGDLIVTENSARAGFAVDGVTFQGLTHAALESSPGPDLMGVLIVEQDGRTAPVGVPTVPVGPYVVVALNKHVSTWRSK